MPIQQTFAIIKPDAVSSGHTGQILGMIEKAGEKAYLIGRVVKGDRKVIYA